MLAIGNDELRECPPIGDTIQCEVCGGIHAIEYGEKVNKDGTREKSKKLAFIKCPSNDNCYLVGIDGKQFKKGKCT